MELRCMVCNNARRCMQTPKTVLKASSDDRFLERCRQKNLVPKYFQCHRFYILAGQFSWKISEKWKPIAADKTLSPASLLSYTFQH
eukprot:4621481-Amphidinium_carterae.2